MAKFKPAVWRSRLQIDDEDRWILSAYYISVRPRSKTYLRLVAVTKTPIDGKKYSSVGVARLILNAPTGAHVDHINGDPFDNRRCNLRLCTAGENNRNQRAQRGSTSRFKGVSARLDGRWMAQICASGNSQYIGIFRDEDEAARAYDTRARELHGEFAAVNFPLAGEQSAVREG